MASQCWPRAFAGADGGLQGLLKLLSYLSVYALMRQLLAAAPPWWDRIVAALLAGELVSAVLAIRQLYGDTTELARWADPNSVADGTIRVYGPWRTPTCWRVISFRSCPSLWWHCSVGAAGPSAFSLQQRC